jgi:hypothetical protein
MKKIITLIILVAFIAVKNNAQTCNLVITPTPICYNYNDPNQLGFVCGGRAGGGMGTITGGEAPYSTNTPGATIYGNKVIFPGYLRTGSQPNTVTKSVTVTDKNGCLIIQNIEVCATINPNYYKFLVTKTNTTCTGFDNGSITANAISLIVPSPPFQNMLSYTVSGVGIPTGSRSAQLGTPINNLPPGTYIVESPDFACWMPENSIPPNPNDRIRRQTIVIDACQPLTLISSIITPAICTAKATAKVVATGAAGNYTYSWNTTPVQTTATATGLIGTAIYTVTVTSGTSTQTSTITIPQVNTILNISIKPKAVSGPRRINPNNTIEVNINNALPLTNTYTYLWSTGATTPSIDLGYKMANNNVTMNATQAMGGGGTQSPTTPVVVTPAPTTTYTVVVKDANGCSGTASYVY